jgi:hypothetical protein
VSYWHTNWAFSCGADAGSHGDDADHILEPSEVLGVSSVVTSAPMAQATVWKQDPEMYGLCTVAS